MSNLTKRRKREFIESLLPCEGSLESLKDLFEDYGIVPTESHFSILKSEWGKKNPGFPIDYVVIEGELFLKGVVFSIKLCEQFRIDEAAAILVQKRSHDIGRKRFPKKETQNRPSEEFSKKLVRTWFEEWFSEKTRHDNGAPKKGG